MISHLLHMIINGISSCTWPLMISHLLHMIINGISSCTWSLMISHLLHMIINDVSPLADDWFFFKSLCTSQSIWLLQLVISSPLIYALVWPESSPHQDVNLGPQHERKTTYQLSYLFPSSKWSLISHHSDILPSLYVFALPNILTVMPNNL